MRLVARGNEAWLSRGVCEKQNLPLKLKKMSCHHAPATGTIFKPRLI